MNFLKKIQTIHINRIMSRYEKYLVTTKRDALATSWSPEGMKKDYELWVQGHHWLVDKSWLYGAEGNLSLPELSPSALKDAAQATVKGIQTKLVDKRRRKYWDNVFAFLPSDMAPRIAGHEYFLQDNDDDLSDWVSLATFSYPVTGVHESRHGFDREFPLGDYALYQRLTEKLQERIGTSLVYVEPVGKATDDRVEINGTIGDMGFRIWVGEGDGQTLFHESEEAPNAWGRKLKHSALVVSPIQRLEGLLNTSLEGTAVTQSPKVQGDFHLITVASETVTAQEYMARADEIREALGVPGLMVSNSAQSKSNQGFFFPSAKTAKANEHGVHYTTFTFYSGNETEVKISEVDLDQHGAPSSVVSGFMPIHSAKGVPRKRKLRRAKAETEPALISA